MKRKMMISLLLMACILAGCTQTATDEDAFGTLSSGEGENLMQSASGEPSQAPSATDDKTADQAEEPGGSSAPDESDGPEESDAPNVGGTPASSLEEPEGGDAPEPDQPVYIDQVPVAETHLEDDFVPMTSAPAALSTMLLPVASGVAVKTSNGAEIDYSNIQDGYVMVRYAASNSQRLRVQVAGPTTTYTYDLPTGSWTTFPLSDGNGDYKVTALQNTTGTKYAVLASVSFQVTLKDEFAPFLRPNQYVNYENAVNTVAMARELTQNISGPLDKVGAVYNYVVGNLSYDDAKAATVQSGYLPNLDSILASQKGICFDYAALMAGMLRSQGVPCKLVVGWAGSVYHAWVSVWTEQTGWIDGVIYFDGTVWQRMDPTFASSSHSSAAIMEYISNGNNYTVCYLY